MWRVCTIITTGAISAAAPASTPAPARSLPAPPCPRRTGSETRPRTAPTILGRNTGSSVAARSRRMRSVSDTGQVGCSGCGPEKQS